MTGVDFIKVVDHFAQDFTVDSFAAECVTDEQGIIANRINQARDATGILPDRVEAFRQEKRGGASGDGESSFDELGQFFAGEGVESAPNRDPLFELADARIGEAVREFGLAGEYDL